MNVRYVSCIILIFLINNLSPTSISYAVPIKIHIRDNQTKITSKNKNITISGGRRSGRNLFHHFQKFDIPKNTTVKFKKANQNTNIINIITSEFPSKLNGKVTSKNKLFFINKRGFNLGDNLKLYIKGRLFIGTPDKILFSDGVYFDDRLYDKKLPLGDPELYVFNENNGRIKINGEGHRITQVGSIFSPNFGTTSTESGVVTSPETDITLAGSSISLNGGQIITPSGNIKIFAIKSGSLNPKKHTFSDTNKYGIVNLNNQSLLNSSGQKSSTTIFGDKINILNESLVIHSNSGSSGQSFIKLVANDINILGQLKEIPEDQRFQTSRGIISQTFNGPGANIIINSRNIRVDRSAGIITSTFGPGKGGGIRITSEIFNVGGGSEFGLDQIGSQVLATSAGSGAGGNIVINSSLNIRDGGFVAAAAFRQGDAGSLTVKAPSGEVSIAGGIFNSAEATFVPSTLGTTTISSGKGGGLRINAQQVSAIDGGRIDASSLNNGDAGSIQIQAQTVTVDGQDINSGTSSSIKSASDEVDPFLTRIFRLPDFPRGNAGFVQIDSDLISVKNGGEISVTSLGKGESGNLELVSNELNVSDGSITASTVNGRGGNIVIDNDLFVLANSSILSANSENQFGGRIDIKVGTLLASPDSIITASSERGQSFEGTINATIQNPQIISPTEISTINQPKINLSQLCGYQGTKISQQGSGGTDEFISDPTLLRAFNLKQRINAINQYKIIDHQTGKIKPFKRLLGIQDEGNGYGRWIFDPKDSPELQHLLLSLNRKCKGYS